jgi:hypothetical protein
MKTAIELATGVPTLADDDIAYDGEVALRRLECRRLLSVSGSSKSR